MSEPKASESMGSSDLFCNQCGHRNPPGSNFCASCGAALAMAGDDTTITFQPVEAGDATDEELTVTLDDLTDGPALLVVKRGPNAGSKFLLDTDVTRVGRHPGSDIFLDDITVSRRHVEVARSGAGYELRDVGSLNGTYLNRQRVEQSVLANGDEIQIGKFKLVFFIGGGTAG
jgi:pSer/pThr/pTyr-binding forkhead associated (FHA) protein